MLSACASVSTIWRSYVIGLKLTQITNTVYLSIQALNQLTFLFIKAAFDLLFSFDQLFAKLDIGLYCAQHQDMQHCCKMISGLSQPSSIHQHNTIYTNYVLHALWLRLNCLIKNKHSHVTFLDYIYIQTRGHLSLQIKYWFLLMNI